jgi:hypothetical protein
VAVICERVRKTLPYTVMDGDEEKQEETVVQHTASVSSQSGTKIVFVFQFSTVSIFERIKTFLQPVFFLFSLRC